MTDNENNFIKRCGDLLNKEENEILINKRIEYAKKFIYPNLIKTVEEFLVYNE